MNAANPAVSTVLDDVANLPARLQAAAADVRDAFERYKLALRARDKLIVKAVDEAHLSQRQVAKHTGVGQPHVIRVLSKTDPDD